MFTIRWLEESARVFEELGEQAQRNMQNRQQKKIKKATKQEGLFKQVYQTIQKLSSNPRHPGLQTHEYDDIENPFDKKQKVFEAYAQNNTPGAYRVFWCYGPGKNEITIIAITSHP